MSDKVRHSSGEPVRTWKRIARYLDRDVRTVQRWEQEAGLPVHRVPGRRSVFAYPDELDDWLRGEELRSPPASLAAGPAPRSGRPLGLSAAAVVLAAALLALWVGWGTGPGNGPVMASRVEVRAGAAVGVDLNGKVVWTSPDPEGRLLVDKGESAVLTSGGEVRHLLAANRSGTRGDNVYHAELSAFTPAGERLWRREARQSLRFAAGSFGPPWVSATVRVLRLEGGVRVAWAVHHFNWWPSMLLLYDGEGGLQGRFVHAGWITALAAREDPRGDQVLAGGISNHRGGAMLAVLDAGAVEGAFPPGPDSPFACLDCPDGGPVRYFVFPPSHVNRGHGLPYNATASVHVTPELTRVIVVEGPPGTYIQWIYDFTPTLELLRVTPSDSYWAEHDRLFRQGHLSHASSACPERDSRSLLEWSPDLGWRQIPWTGPAG